MVSKLLAAAKLAHVIDVWGCRNVPVQTNNTRDKSTGRSMLGYMVSIGSRRRRRYNLLMIQESAVLLRVEHLEERASRVSIYSFANLVDFIDEN